MQFEIKWDAQWGGLVFIYASKLLMIVYCTNKIDTMSPFWWLLANKVDNKIITLSFWLGLSHDLLCNDGWQWQDIVASRCRPTWDDVDTAVLILALQTKGIGAGDKYSSTDCHVVLACIPNSLSMECGGTMLHQNICPWDQMLNWHVVVDLSLWIPRSGCQEYPTRGWNSGLLEPHYSDIVQTLMWILKH